MNATDDNLPAMLNIHIVSFGTTGNAAAVLLAQDVPAIRSLYRGIPKTVFI